RNSGLRQASAQEYYGGMLILRGDGTIELSTVVIRQREQSLNQSSNTIYTTSGDINITNCSFERAQFRNDYLSSIRSASIYCEDKFGSLSVVQTNISQQYTSFINPPTDDDLRLQNNIEYGSGCIVILNAQNLKLQECSFIQNQGWRTGVVNIQQMSKNWISPEIDPDSNSPKLSIKQCKFEDNYAIKERTIQDITLKRYNGNDIILDHQYTKNSIMQSFNSSSSSSPVPKVGSQHKQFAVGVFDYILFTRRTADISYASLNGKDQLTGTSGNYSDPLRTIEYAAFYTTSSQLRQSQIYVFPGVFNEKQIFVGGHSLQIIGTKVGSIEPTSVQLQSDKPGPSIIQNSEQTDDDLIQVFNGILTLQLLVIQIDNNDDMPKLFSAIVIHGQLASATIDYCDFRTTNSKGFLDRDFLILDKGGNLTMRFSQAVKIFENYRPVLCIDVSEKSNFLLQQCNITSCEIYDPTSSVLHLNYYTGGTATIDQCQFRYNTAVTPEYIGNRPIAGSILIQLCESYLSTSYRPESQQQQLNNTRVLTIRDCRFDSNIGDCGGSITVSGTRSLLSEERIVFTRCQFENNIASSYYMNPDDPHGNDIYFYVWGMHY
ncbi:MAG: hypothetical protein EZS28_034198, partial [Streblomastix strix]